MTDYSEWRISGDNYGDVTLWHTVCSHDVYDPGSCEMTLADVMQAIEEHDCPRPSAPALLEIPEPLVYEQKRIGNVVFPVVRR